MPILREINHLKTGEHFSQFIKLDGGFGGDFGLKVFRQTWFDNNSYRISVAALDPSGGETSLIAHFDFKMGGLVDESGTLIDAFLPDTAAFVVWNNKEWQNKRAIMSIIAKHWNLPDEFGEFAGTKPLDFVWRNPKARPADIESGRIEAKVTWDDFELMLVFDLVKGMVEFREIDPAFRAPLLTYFCNPSNDPVREMDGQSKPPKHVIDETVAGVLKGLSDLKPTYVASKRTARFKSLATDRSAAITFRADRNNKAGIYVGMAVEVSFDGGTTGDSPPQMPEELAWRARNISPYWYELSRCRQRGIVMKNLVTLLSTWLEPWLLETNLTE
jgi:hypothetical protein